MSHRKGRRNAQHVTSRTNFRQTTMDWTPWKSRWHLKISCRTGLPFLLLQTVCHHLLLLTPSSLALTESKNQISFVSSFIQHRILSTSSTFYPQVYSAPKREKGSFLKMTTTSNDVTGTNQPTESSPSAALNQCRILCLSDPNDANNAILYNKSALPDGAKVVHVMCLRPSDGDTETVIASLLDIIRQEGVNTIFVSHESAQYLLSAILPRLSSDIQNTQGDSHPIVWIHSRSAGIDAYMSPELCAWHENGGSHVQMTNARGVFSSSLAEYCLGACSYFCKDFERLKRNQRNRSWDRYDG